MQEVFAEDDGVVAVEVFDVLADGAARAAGKRLIIGALPRNWRTIF